MYRMILISNLREQKSKKNNVNSKNILKFESISLNTQVGKKVWII